jgi:hypothetical protein
MHSFCTRVEVHLLMRMGRIREGADASSTWRPGVSGGPALTRQLALMRPVGIRDQRSSRPSKVHINGALARGGRGRRAALTRIGLAGVDQLDPAAFRVAGHEGQHALGFLLELGSLGARDRGI